MCSLNERRKTLNPDKYNRQIPLVCPTCGGDQFETQDDIEGSASVVKCISCERKFTKNELVRENGENIDAHISEINAQVVEDIKKDLRKSFKEAFRGNKNITIK